MTSRWYYKKKPRATHFAKFEKTKPVDASLALSIKQPKNEGKDNISVKNSPKKSAVPYDPDKIRSRRGDGR